MATQTSTIELPKEENNETDDDKKMKLEGGSNGDVVREEKKDMMEMSELKWEDRQVSYCPLHGGLYDEKAKRCDAELLTLRLSQNLTYICIYSYAYIKAYPFH